MADFVFMLLASGSGPARVTVQGRVSEEQKRDPSGREKQRFFPLFLLRELETGFRTSKSPNFVRLFFRHTTTEKILLPTVCFRLLSQRSRSRRRALAPPPSRRGIRPTARARAERAETASTSAGCPGGSRSPGVGDVCVVFVFFP